MLLCTLIHNLLYVGEATKLQARNFLFQSVKQLIDDLGGTKDDPLYMGAHIFFSHGMLCGLSQLSNQTETAYE